MKQHIKTTIAGIEDAIKNAQPGNIVLLDSKGKVLKQVVKCEEDTRTDQSYGELTNIKTLVSKTEAKGLLRASTKWEGEMDDFPAYDYQEAQFQIARAKTMFESLPSGIRVKFENDPVKFVTFANNPDNAQAMIDMGLKKGIDGVDHTGTNTVQSDGVTPTSEVINPPPEQSQT
jgi:hypothetical protein